MPSASSVSETAPKQGCSGIGLVQVGDVAEAGWSVRSGSPAARRPEGRECRSVDLGLWGRRRFTFEAALALVMPGGLSRSRAPDGAGQLSPVSQVDAAFEDAEQLLFGFLGTHSGACVTGGELVAPAAKQAGDLPTSNLSERSEPFVPSGTSRRWATTSPATLLQLVYGFLQIELARAGTLVVGVVHGRDQDLAVALGVG